MNCDKIIKNNLDSTKNSFIVKQLKEDIVWFEKVIELCNKKKLTITVKKELDDLLKEWLLVVNNELLFIEFDILHLKNKAYFTSKRLVSIVEYKKNLQNLELTAITARKRLNIIRDISKIKNITDIEEIIQHYIEMSLYILTSSKS